MLSLLSRWTGKGKAEEEGFLFPGISKQDEAGRDCADCTACLPASFKIDHERRLYGTVKPVDGHLLVATGKTDWTRTPFAALSLALRASSLKTTVLASNLSRGDIYDCVEGDKESEDRQAVLLLPAFVYLDCAPADLSSLSPIIANKPYEGLSMKECLYDHVVLLCSHRSRDARCGISAPLLKRELERHLRPLGLHRDAGDQRPGGVGVFFVSHVGGHKHAANVIVYRREAEQMIWLARIRPEHCEGIVRHTILEGRVVAPEDRLKGGFDCRRGLTSW